jgi:hypothetical protein
MFGRRPSSRQREHWNSRVPSDGVPLSARKRNGPGARGPEKQAGREGRGIENKRRCFYRETHPGRPWEGDHACTCGGAGAPSLLTHSMSPDRRQRKDQVKFLNYPLNFCFGVDAVSAGAGPSPRGSLPADARLRGCWLDADSTGCSPQL